MSKTLDELSQSIADKERELSESLKSLHIIEQAILLLQRDILDKQRQKKDFEITRNKAMHNFRQLTITIRLLKNEFWAMREENKP